MEVADRLRAALAGRFELERELGRGGMAVVYLARDLKLQRLVAVKVLRPELAASLAADRFLREITIAAELQHPLIVPLYDSGETPDGLLWYAMPYVQGETLRERLSREQQLPIEDALAITADAAQALTCAHAYGVVHRDIKPENILLSGGRAMIADFGIARALTQAAGGATSSGVVVGTPQYMSPEQGSGNRVLDARSDIYSLACVLYEMLAGEPPFTGPTPQAVIAKHVSERVPSLQVVRPSISRELEDVVVKALAKVPADRFASADQLQRALAGAPAGGSRVSPWKHKPALVIAATVAVTALYVILPRALHRLDLKASQYVVASFLTERHGQGAADYALLEYELMSAMRDVPNITVVERTLLNDRLMRVAPDSVDFAYWRQVTRDLRAGRLLVPSLVGRGETTRLVAEVYDVSSGRLVRRAEVREVPGAGTADAVPRLVERLFGLPDGVLRVARSSVDAAQRAFVAGRTALESWDLPRAGQQFQQAATLDPDYAEAHFWLAQTEAWAGDSTDEWIGAARRAVLGQLQLTDDKEKALAQALLAMAERRFPRACAQYDSLVAADSLDFEAWLGLGECRKRDDAVLPDATSPSGFRFRSSNHAAVSAYERALEVAPSFAFQFRPLTRLAGVLPVEPWRLRAGTGVAPDTTRFSGAAALDHDTLASVPWRLSDIIAGRAGVLSPSINEAVARNRERLLRIVTNWVRVFPDSFAGYQALAFSLELTGALGGTGNVQRSALAAVRRARSLARTEMDSVQSAVAEVRVLAKLGRFEEARQLGEETLRRWEDPDPLVADSLDGLAAFLGQGNLSARLSARAALRVTGDNVPVLVTQAWRALDAYAALGAPVDSIVALAARLDASVQSVLPPAAADQFRCTGESTSLARAFPQLRRVTKQARCRAGAPMLEMQWALVRGDAAAVRAAFARGRAMRRLALPGDVALDHVLQETWVLLQVGDTATAVAYVDRTLAALGTLRTSTLREPPQAGALVRLMALRAELAAAAGDRAAARRWAEPVVVLWRDADPAFGPVVRRMQSLSQAP